MPLTTEQLVEILSGLGDADADPNADKRRRAVRVKHREAVTIVPFVAGKPRSPKVVEMVDFSSRGVQMHFDDPIPAASHFVLALPRTNGRPVQLLCEVMHCRTRSDGKFQVGAEFIGFPPTGATDPTGAESRAEASRIASSILG